MKRLFSLAYAAFLLLGCLPALAESTPGILPWHIGQVQSGAAADFDGDGITEAFIYTESVNEYRDGGFTISINSYTMAQDSCVYLSGDVYVMFVGAAGYSRHDSNYYYGALFMVPEYGPSDDPYTYCYLYTNGQLYDVGQIPALPENMQVDAATGLITTQVRAEMIGTWSRPADYMLARGFHWSDNGFSEYYHMVEVPRDIYPCGMIVTLKTTLPLLTDKGDTDYETALSPTQHKQVIIAATDDRRWAYVSSMDGETAGWVRMSQGQDGWGTYISVNGTLTNVDDVFGDIIYAD